jgi:UDP-glucose 4-epimerase
MILIIGGLGFIGSNTAQALLDIGEDCVLVQRQDRNIPAFLKSHVGKRIFIETLDATNLRNLEVLGKQYPFTGIVHLATGGMPVHPSVPALELVQDVQATLISIATVFQVAQTWKVNRVALASAPVIYNGISNLPWREDQALPMTASFSMELAKKCGELVSSYLSLHTQVDYVELRLAAIYGPHYDPARSSLIGRLVHAGVRGTKPDLAGLRFGSLYAEDGGDQCYVKDTARAIARLLTTEKLGQHVYNIASGRPTTNQEIVNTIKKVIPGFDVELPVGSMPGNPGAWYFDIAKLCQDTGYQPAFDLEAGITNYVEWLRAGNAR